MNFKRVIRFLLKTILLLFIVVIVLAVVSGGGLFIWQYYAHKTAVKLVTTNQSLPPGIAPQPSAQTIQDLAGHKFFVAGRDESHNHSVIHEIDRVGVRSKPLKVNNEYISGGMDLTLSPDEKTLAFIRSSTDGSVYSKDVSYQVVLLDVALLKEKVVFDTSTQQAEGDPSSVPVEKQNSAMEWSKDGKKLFFAFTRRYTYNTATGKVVASWDSNVDKEIRDLPCAFRGWDNGGFCTFSTNDGAYSFYEARAIGPASCLFCEDSVKYIKGVNNKTGEEFLLAVTHRRIGSGL